MQIGKPSGKWPHIAFQTIEFFDFSNKQHWTGIFYPHRHGDADGAIWKGSPLQAEIDTLQTPPCRIADQRSLGG